MPLMFDFITENHILVAFFSVLSLWFCYYFGWEITLHKFVCWFTLAAASFLARPPNPFSRFCFFSTRKILFEHVNTILFAPAKSIDWIMDFPASQSDVWLTEKYINHSSFGFMFIIWYFIVLLRLMLINWMSSHFDVLLSCASLCWIMCRARERPSFASKLIIRRKRRHLSCVANKMRRKHTQHKKGL